MKTDFDFNVPALQVALAAQWTEFDFSAFRPIYGRLGLKSCLDQSAKMQGMMKYLFDTMLVEIQLDQAVDAPHLAVGTIEVEYRHPQGGRNGLRIARFTWDPATQELQVLAR